MSRELKEIKLQSYIRQGCSEGIQSLVNEGGGVNLNLRSPDGTMLMLAAKISHWNIVELLIDLGADINNTYGEKKWKILHFAARDDWMPVIQLFIDKKLDLDQKSTAGETPLMIAVRFNRKDIVELLVNAGANINDCDVKKWTAVHYAALRQRMEMLRFLVKKGANIDAQCQSGWTPLHFILKLEILKLESVTENVSLMIRLGADCNLKDNRGISAFNHLITNEWLSVIRLSIRKGAYVSSYDYKELVDVLVLKDDVLKCKKYCSRSIINKHNKGLRDIFKLYEASAVLPSVQAMKIKDTSGISAEIDRVIERDMGKYGFCNLATVRPLSLSMMCVTTLLEHVEKVRGAPTYSFGVCRGLRRAAVQEKPAKRMCLGNSV